MEYNRFFNLHIPKTGGTYFRENLLKAIEPQLINKNIALNPDGNGGITDTPTSPTFHWCWFKPFITDNTFIFSSFRDPAQRIISHYAWQARRVSTYHTENIKHEINKDNFFKWFESNYDVFKNFQSKNLTYYNTDHSIYKEAQIVGWDKNQSPIIKSFLFDKDFINFKISKEELLANIKRIDILVDSSKLSNLDYQYKVLDRIIDAFKISPPSKILSQYGNQNEYSSILFDQFTIKEIDNLYSHSSIDSEIYFSNIFTHL